MQVSTERFDLTPSDKRGIEDFKEYLFYNSEVCSNCFTRVREIDDRKILRGKNRHIEDVFEFHERTEQAESEFTPWDSNPLYGTTFCLECGSDCSADHEKLTLEQLKPLAKNIFVYTTQHTPLGLDGKRFGREIKDMKAEPRFQGKESQILAVAFARSLE